MLAEHTQPIVATLATNAGLTRGQRFARRLAGLVVGSLILITVLPVLMTLALMIQADGQGAPLARQAVRTEKGRTVGIYQFRVPNRAIGRWLRETNLHLLPQLLNVVKGDMHLR